MSGKNQKPATTNEEQASETTAVAVPDYMKQFMQQNQADTQSAAAASISVPRLSFRGKRFRWIEDGNETLVKDLTVDVIILGVEPEAGRMIKTYYEKAYQSGDSEPPTCSSSDGIRPDSWVSTPQARTCAECKFNVFGSATSQSGGKAKACKDGKRLWVSKQEDPTKPFGLNVPVTSLKNLSEYGKFIARNQYPLAMVITELGLDDDSEFPKLLFKHKGFVAEEHVNEVIQLNTERPWRLQFASTPMLPDGHQQSALPAPAAPTPSAPSAPTASVAEVVGAWD